LSLELPNHNASKDSDPLKLAILVGDRGGFISISMMTKSSRCARLFVTSRCRTLSEPNPMRSLRSLAVVLMMLCRMTSPVCGQSAQPSSNEGSFVHLRSGHCTIRVELRDGANLGAAILLRNENATLAHPRLKGTTGQMRSVEFRVQQPPILDEQFAMSVNGATVMASPGPGIPTASNS
jgi:hypothetical protein